jgi:DNA-directed RNA polymerase specialized sigma24 family protein
MMDESDWLAERFEEHRSHFRAVAYRMLGSVSEADDAVQEAWLRLSRADTSSVENLGGWLTRVVARVCLDMLRSRKSRREESLDAPGLAQPATRMEWVGGQADGVDPGQEALLADSVGLALLVVLRCWSQPSGWRSSCTTCLPSPSTRARQPRPPPRARSGQA